MAFGRASWGFTPPLRIGCCVTMIVFQKAGVTIIASRAARNDLSSRALRSRKYYTSEYNEPFTVCTLEHRSPWSLFHADSERCSPYAQFVMIVYSKREFVNNATSREF